MSTQAEIPGLPAIDWTNEAIPQGPNVLLMGPAGTGKTDSIGTLIDLGMDVRYMGLEKGWESVLGYFARKKRPLPNNVAWHQVKSPKAGFKELKEMAHKIGTIPMDTLLKLPDNNKAKWDWWEQILTVMSNFTDQRTGKDLGAVDDWNPNTVFVVDGLTGLNQAIMQRVVGSKPIRSPQDWGVAQDQLEAFLRMLTTHTRCWVVVIAHVEREMNQITGGSKIAVSTLGKALPPKVPAMFSDVILAERKLTKWTWNTIDSDAEVKCRNIPWAADQNPDFKTLYDNWFAGVQSAVRQIEA